MELPTYFDRFLKEIRPTQNQRDDCRTGHQTLRNRLHADEGLKSIVVSTFLQGSYRRATAVRPKEDSRSDVDIIVVTRLNRDDYQDPDKAMDVFVPFLKRYYAEKYRRQGRSFGIELSYVDLDLVITSAPSESEQEINEIYENNKNENFKFKQKLVAGKTHTAVFPAEFSTALEWIYNEENK